MACFDSSPLCMEFNEEYEASIASSIVVPAPLFQQECALIQRRHRPANLRKNQAQKFAPIPRVVITQVDFSSGPSLWNWRIAAHGLVAINIRLLMADVVSAQPSGQQKRWTGCAWTPQVRSKQSSRASLPQYWVDRRWPRLGRQGVGNNPAAEYVNSVMADLRPFCRYSAQTRH